MGCRGAQFQRKLQGGSRRPGTKSLWLLPSGPDQVGDSAVRRLPSGHMVEARSACKFMMATTRSSSPVHPVEPTPALMPLAALILPMLVAGIGGAPNANPVVVTGHQWA